MTKLYGRATVDVKVKVLTVYTESIMYKEWGHLDGPSYEIKQKNVHKIVYESGKVDYFASIPELPKYKPVKFQCYISAIGLVAPSIWGVGEEMSYGLNIYDYGYAGLYLGVGCLFSNSSVYGDYAGYFPIGLDLKGYFLKDRKVLPFANCVVGGFLGVENSFNGAYLQLGVGADVSYFSFGVKYNAFMFGGKRLDACAFHLGLRFGGWNYK